MWIEPRLVPARLWGVSVYGLIGRTSSWKRLRERVYEQAGGTCQVCAKVQASHMVCDEIWDYDEETHIAMLAGFRLLCSGCNGVTHIGQAGARSKEALRKSLAHMAKVNRISLEDAEEMRKKALREWRLRSRHRWHVRVAPDLISEHPELRGIEARLRQLAQARSSLGDWASEHRGRLKVRPVPER